MRIQAAVYFILGHRRGQLRRLTDDTDEPSPGLQLRAVRLFQLVAKARLGLGQAPDIGVRHGYFNDTGNPVNFMRGIAEINRLPIGAGTRQVDNDFIAGRKIWGQGNNLQRRWTAVQIFEIQNVVFCFLDDPGSQP
ncbi:hypothetical protein D3C77_378480 [compost metagenome]